VGTGAPGDDADAQVRAADYANLVFRVHADGTVVDEMVITDETEFTLTSVDEYTTLQLEVLVRPRFAACGRPKVLRKSADGTRKPAIPTPNAIELRAVQTAISNARQRIEAIEASLGTVSATVQAASGSSVSLNALRAEVATLEGQISALQALMANPANGIVVKNGAALITRTLVGLGSVTITNADGVAGTHCFGDGAARR